jgi:DAK2 domain fusion protein YloV
MPAAEVIDGAVVRLWFRLAADALGRTKAAIDMLNVFPVADSDTGTNLHRTILSASEAVAALPAQASAAEVWQAGAAAALLGACGNSGIIVSQLLRGLADTCGPASPCDGSVVAAALAHAAALAREAVLRPIEGTLLTVADAAAAAAACCTDLPGVSQAAARGARQALAATPRKLDVLAASGVVDAGGAGLCVVLDALSAAVSGIRPQEYEVPVPRHVPARAYRTADSVPEYEVPEYEVTFVIEAAESAMTDLRGRLGEIGDSVVVSGTGRQWHVHAHGTDAGAIIEAGLAVGRPTKITITCLNTVPATTAATRPMRPMDRARADPPVAAAQAPTWPSAVVAVVEGAGLRAILTQAGATVVAPEVNAAELDLDAVAAARTQATLITGSRRLRQQWPPGWPVIEVESPVQSLAAVAVHDGGSDQAADIASMRRAVAGVRWASLVASAPGEHGPRYHGYTADGIAAVGEDQASVAFALADLLLANGPEMITLLTGRDADHELPAAVTARVAASALSAEVVCYDGGMASAVLVMGAE